MPHQYVPRSGPSAGRKRGWFGRRKHDDTSELEELRAWIAQAHGVDAAQVAGLVERTPQEAAVLLTRARTEAEGIVEEARQAVKVIKSESKQVAKDAERTREEAAAQRELDRE